MIVWFKETLTPDIYRLTKSRNEQREHLHITCQANLRMLSSTVKHTDKSEFTDLTFPHI